MDATLTGIQAGNVCARILCNKMDAKNTFDEPNAVEYVPFDGVEKTDKGIAFTLPACSVLQIIVEEA